MKKLIALPALALATVFAAHPACAASADKPAAASATTMPSPTKWAQMPAGKQHTLRNKIALRSTDDTNWKNQKAVLLTARDFDKHCFWKDHVDEQGNPQTTPYSLDKAVLLVDTDSNPPRLNVIFANKKVVSRNLTYSDGPTESRWLSSTPATDWNYYVLLEDTKPTAHQKDPIDKLYRVEIFPPAGVNPACDPERPENAVKEKVARVDGKRHGIPCEAGTGNGGEPK